MNIIGMALNGFDIPNVGNINFTVQPSYSFANNTFMITVIVGTTSNPLNMLTYSIMLFNSANSDVFDLQNPCTLWAM